MRVVLVTVSRGRILPATRTISRLALLLTLLCVALAPLAGTAQAADSQLCSGYVACNAGTFTTHGYENAAGTSWWSMYAGINCTNYVAYVESQVYGVSRPSLLLGNAYQWAANAAAMGIPVDSTPRVGAVAVWGAGTPGMGSDGHVAVVEAVAADGSYIDVSQSGMALSGDGFDWERVYRTGGSWEPWPSSFIHFAGPAIPGTVPQLGLWMPGAKLAIAGS